MTVLRLLIFTTIFTNYLIAMQHTQPSQIDSCHYDQKQNEYVYKQSDGQTFRYRKTMSIRNINSKTPKVSYGIWKIITHANERAKIDPSNKPALKAAVKHYCLYHDINQNPIGNFFIFLSHQQNDAIYKFHRDIFELRRKFIQEEDNDWVAT